MTLKVLLWDIIYYMCSINYKKFQNTRQGRIICQKFRWTVKLCIYIKNSKENRLEAFLKLLEATTGCVLWEKVFLEISQNSQKNTCTRVSFLIKLLAEACSFITKDALAQVFSCEFREISRNNLFTEHLQTTSSENKVMMVNQ